MCFFILQSYKEEIRNIRSSIELINYIRLDLIRSLSKK